MDLEDKLALMPSQPGVYLMKNREGTILYVGKAKNLRSRVRRDHSACDRSGNRMGRPVDFQTRRIGHLIDGNPGQEEPSHPGAKKGGGEENPLRRVAETIRLERAPGSGERRRHKRAPSDPSVFVP